MLWATLLPHSMGGEHVDERVDYQFKLSINSKVRWICIRFCAEENIKTQKGKKYIDSSTSAYHYKIKHWRCCSHLIQSAHGPRYCPLHYTSVTVPGETSVLARLLGTILYYST